MFIKSIIHSIFALLGLVATFYSVGKFMFFLSEPQNVNNTINESSVVYSLFIDISLLSTFIIPHTFMVLPSVKKIQTSYGLDVISRSIYVLSSSLFLMVLMRYWHTVTKIVLWSFDTTKFLIWFMFIGLHVISWSIIYFGCLFMDISELLGVKQVYYSIKNMPDPIEFKSSDLKRLYGHTRHPSFSAFLIIFWICPIMTLDRLVLATIMTIYMFLTWKTDKYDLNYHQAQYIRKTRELQDVH